MSRNVHFTISLAGHLEQDPSNRSLFLDLVEELGFTS